jgi:hypothetical protein
MTQENNSDEFKIQHDEQKKDARIERSLPPVGNITIQKLDGSVLISQPMGKRNSHELEIFNDGTWADRIRCNGSKPCEKVEIPLLILPTATFEEKSTP